MGTLPGLPFRVGVGIYSWAEKKADNLPYPRLKRLATYCLQFCQEHPLAGLFCLLGGAMSLGPITFLVGFLVFANTCLLIGGVIFEFMILATALSFFLPTIALIIFISMAITSVLAFIAYILYGGNTSHMIFSRSTKQDLSTKSKDWTPSSMMSDLLNKEVDFVNKMTQTTEWVEKTLQNVDEISHTILES